MVLCLGKDLAFLFSVSCRSRFVSPFVSFFPGSVMSFERDDVTVSRQAVFEEEERKKTVKGASEGYLHVLKFEMRSLEWILVELVT